MTYISWFSDFAFWVCVLLLLYILNFLMIKMLQYKMYPAGELSCPTTALVKYVQLHVQVCNLYIPREKWLNYLQTVDPDQMLHFAASDVGLHCLPFALLGVSRLQGVEHVKKIIKILNS